jgi:HEAT repeats
MQRQCIVLHQSVSRAEIDYTAYKGLWVFARVVKDSKDTVREVIFQEVIPPKGVTENFMHYMIEKVKDLPYLIVDGEDIQAAVKEIHTSLPIHSREDIIRMIQSPGDQEEYIKGILYLGLQGKFKECDNETLEIFKQVLQHENPEVRRTAVIAMSYAGWSEFQDLVKSLAKEDPDINVRETAARFLKGEELP